MVLNKVYKGCSISFLTRVTLVHLIEFDMLDFDVIFGMCLLNACLSSLYFRTRIVKP